VTRPAPAVLLDLLNDAPSVERLVVVRVGGESLGAVGGRVAAGAEDAVARLWETGSRAAANRSPAPLDHLIVQTTAGVVVIIKDRGVLVAAVGREGTRPDMVACELRRAAAVHLAGDSGHDNGATNGTVREGEA
jgi:hypothetical protein